MKNSSMYITFFTILSFFIISGCNNSTRKVENAQEDVTEAKKELNEANREYAVEMAKYKKDTEAKIVTNQKIIDDFKLRIENEKSEVKASYNKIIAELEQQNNDLGKKMDDYKAESKDQWESFKTEFSRDMDNLGKAFKDLSEDNIK
ncbi:MAG: hypothetical protein ACJA2S_004336 [Cyclobacteriaceae bacterium]|jgi:hypothetical protein